MAWSMGFGVWGLGFGVWGLLASLSYLRSVRFAHELASLGWGLRFGVQGSRFKVQGSRFKV
jgi:hypothetical protein